MTAAEVTVVVPTRNRCSLLRQTISTVLGQQDVEVEAVVVDDGSTDATPALLAGIDDPRLRVVRREEGSSCAAARNAGAKVAGAPWIAFVDDDDLWAPDKLRAQLDAVVRARATWSCTGAVSVDDDLRILRAHTLDEARWREQLPARNPIPAGGSSVMVRRDLFEATGGFDEGLRIMEDWDLWNRLGPDEPLAGVARPLVAYRRHASSISRSANPIVVHNLIRDRYAGATAGAEATAGPEAATLEWMARQQVQGGHRWAAARTYLAVAAAGSWRKGLAMAVLAPLAPVRWTRRWERLARDAVPPDWIAEAEGWLAPLRSG